MQMQRKIPLHGTGDAMERLSLHADMASLNPQGFRTSSEKKDRKRIRNVNRNRKHPRGRPMTRAEKLAEEAA